MIRRCLVLICALTSCAPASREVWLKSLSERSEGLCWWRKARWEDQGTLMVRGTGEPFAHARARWEGEQWRGTSVTAVLRKAGPLVVLQGEWTGPGLTLRADVDLASQAVFRAYEPARVGSAGLLLKGGHVRVVDAMSGRALVLPAEESLRSFRPDQGIALELSCEALSLSAGLEPGGDAQRRLLAQSGFPSDSPERWVPDHFSLPASAQFGGVTVGHFVGESAPVRGFVVEQKKDEARLVVPTTGGVVWVGWVAADGLTTQGSAAPVPVKAPSLPQPVSNDWRSCERSELPVDIESFGSMVEVGTLQPGAAFSIVSRRGGYCEVRLGIEWLELEPDVRLFLPARACDCPPHKQLGAW